MDMNDGTLACTLTDIWASLPIAMGGELTMFIAVPPNCCSVRVAMANEVSGVIFEQEIAGLATVNAVPFPAP